jgi:hypothetical protein
MKSLASIDVLVVKTDDYTPRPVLVSLLRRFALGSRQLIRNATPDPSDFRWSLLRANVRQMVDLADELRTMRGMSPRAISGETS